MPLKTRSIRRRARLELEALENRLAPVGNLTVTGAFVVDGNNQPITPLTGPVVGEQVFLRAEWTSSGLAGTEQFVVRFAVDGVPLDSFPIQGVAGQNVRQSLFFDGGWFLASGQRTITVMVDATNTVAETDETDNSRTFTYTPASPTTLPNRFVLPIGGMPFRDWAVTAYADTDPRPGQVRDYRGGPFTYDGHDAIDFAIGTFRRQDNGIPVYAAAAGTVTFAQDGYFDRETTFANKPANMVRIDHGGGWATEYLHLRRGSVFVRPGEFVQAGQQIGWIGSSGRSTGAHVHFEVKHNGAKVETMLAPTVYWVNPPAYQGSVAPAVLDQGITNLDLTPPAGTALHPDMQEGPSDIRVFHTSYNGFVTFWFWLSHLNHTSDQPGLARSDVLRVRWFRPDGTEVPTNPVPFTQTLKLSPFVSRFQTQWALFPGTWRVAVDVNGTQVASSTFQIQEIPPLNPEIRITLGNSTAGPFISNGRRTPIDFGRAAQGAAAPQQTFTVQNHGYGPLTLTNLTLPPGFSLVGTFPASVPEGASRTFTVRMDTATAGQKSGYIQFNTNDFTDFENNCSFAINGVVTDPADMGNPRLMLPGMAQTYRPGQPPLTVSPQATLTDSDSLNFGGGMLEVMIRAGGTADDRVALPNQGNGPGQIDLSGPAGDRVSYGGVVIGRVTYGPGGDSLVVEFNANANLEAVQAVVRAVTFQNVAATPTAGIRRIGFLATDDTGKDSGWVEAPVNVVVNQPPTISMIPNQTTRAGIPVGPIPFTVSDAETPAAALTVMGTSSNQVLVPNANIVLGGAGMNRTVTVTPAPNQTGTATITLTVRDGDGATATSSFTLTVNPPPLRPNPVVPRRCGFRLSFNQPIDPSTLNLYDTQTGGRGPADVTLVGATTGPVQGSLIVDPDNLAITFQRTGGVLPPDTYTLTLRSAADGFRDASGELLDGDGDGIPGGNYTTTFTVAASTAPIVGVPDLTRGPGQTANLPLHLSNGAGVTSINLTLLYNPALLSITAASVGSGLPTGATATLNTSTPGSAVITFSSPTPLGAGAVDFVTLTARVPDAAPYASKHLLDLTNIQINGGTIPSLDDDGIHLVGYLGDTTGNAGYSAVDAQRALRAALGLDGGFSAYRLADPILMADVTGNGVINATDATRILQAALGIPQTSIPPLPGVLPPIVPGGPDPYLSFPTTFTGRPGERVTVPLNLDLSDGLEAADLAISYDASRLQIESEADVQRGSLTGDFDLFAVNLDQEAGTLRVGLGHSAGPIGGRGSGSVLAIAFRIRPDAPPGPAIINLRHRLDPVTTQLNEGSLELVPEPSDEAGDVLDGLVAVQSGKEALSVNLGPKEGAIDYVFALLNGKTRGMGKQSAVAMALAPAAP